MFSNFRLLGILLALLSLVPMAWAGEGGGSSGGGVGTAETRLFRHTTIQLYAALNAYSAHSKIPLFSFDQMLDMYSLVDLKIVSRPYFLDPITLAGKTLSPWANLDEDIVIVSEDKWRECSKGDPMLYANLLALMLTYIGEDPQGYNLLELVDELIVLEFLDIGAL